MREPRSDFSAKLREFSLTTIVCKVTVVMVTFRLYTLLNTAILGVTKLK